MTYDTHHGETVDTEIEKGECADAGADHELRITESFTRNGEQVERETTVSLNNDGSAIFDQHVQGMYDCITLSSDALDRLQAERNDADEKDIEAVYRERNLLACALAQATGAPAGWKYDDSDNGPEWAIVWIETPVGQVAWHVPRDMADRLAPPRRDADYSGYSRNEKNDRLASWAQSGCPF